MRLAWALQPPLGSNDTLHQPRQGKMVGKDDCWLKPEPAETPPGRGLEWRLVDGLLDLLAAHFNVDE